MNQKGNKIKNKIVSISTGISSFLIPIFQYVPCTAVWFGIMSVPVITYIAFFFQNPGILIHDLLFLFRIPGTYIALFGFTFYIYALIFQITHRKQLIRNGPYKFVRHPQYLAFIVMTFGMTLVAFQTYPIVGFNPFNISSYTIILLIWIGEVLAYIILGKIEDIALKSKYRDEYLKYVNNVPFMVPLLRLNNKKEE
ncbi:MAG: methyltransferase family protein [Candidatus Hermodarchaeota archaeon]